MPKFVISVEGHTFVLKDTAGVVYGRYPSREEAENAKMDWEIYYES